METKIHKTKQPETCYLFENNDTEFLGEVSKALGNIIVSLRQEQKETRKEFDQEIERLKNIVEQKEEEICGLKGEIERKKLEEIHQDIQPVPQKTFMKTNKLSRELIGKKHKKSKNKLIEGQIKESKSTSVEEMKENRYSLQIGSLMNSEANKENHCKKRLTRLSSSNIINNNPHPDKSSPNPFIKRKSEGFLKNFNNSSASLVELSNLSVNASISPKCESRRFLYEDNILIEEETERSEYESERKAEVPLTNKMKLHQKPIQSKKVVESKKWKARVESLKQKSGNVNLTAKMINAKGTKPR